VAFLVGQGGEMSVVFDTPPAVVAPGMAGDFRLAIEHADDLFRSDERQGPADERVRDRVVIAVEAKVRRLARAEGADDIAGQGVLG
jgi:hypothetical protein